MKARLFAKENLLMLLLVFLPVALLLEWVFHAGELAIFITSALAIIPLAGLMGRATERLAERLGEGVGGLLNATFGNAAELIIAVMALREGFYDLVKASITGSIIGNILLVFGLSALIGGLRFSEQRFNRTAASLGTTLLVLSAVGLVVPAIFHMVTGGSTAVLQATAEQDLSLEIAIVLMATYLISLVFTLLTHRHLYVGGGHAGEVEAGTAAPAHRGGVDWGALTLLLVSTAGIALMAELLVGAAEVTAESLGWNEIFVGVILVA
ncbi:MAG: calcium/proton exchanger, partial [Longimicrobiales bacterium]